MRIRIDLLYFSALFFWFALYATAATIAAQAERLANLSPFIIGAMLSGFGAALILSRVPIGIVATRWNKRPLIGFGLLVIATGNVLVYVFPESTVPLLIAKTILGFGAGFWVVYSIFYVRNALEGQGFALGTPMREQISKPMSKITSTHGIGVALGVIAGSIFVQQWGWHTPFLFGTLAAIVAMTMLLFVKEEKDPSPSFDVQYLLKSLRNTRLLGVSLAGALVFFILTSTGWGFTQNFAREATPWQLGVIVSSMVIPYAIGIRYAYLFRKWPVERMIAICFGLTGIAVVAIPFSVSVMGISLLHAIIGGTLGVVYSTVMSLSIEDQPHEHWGEVMGLFQSIYALGFFLGPLTAGVVGSTLGLEYIFMINGLLTFSVALLIPFSLFVARSPVSRRLLLLQSTRIQS